MPDNINFKTVSEQFVKIYEQAVKAEAFELDELVGLGYRRAFEFLVKDYLKARFPDAAPRIEEMPLATCIKEYFDDQRITQAAERTVWLMNDATHYIKLHGDKDLSDLKRVMSQALYWIAISISSEQDAQTIVSKR